ncbi:hypothetical protein Sinac_4328 [Singulisphaera acidiphila DSM 18658]|uniref:Uncharacterized protein n=1 Tax=Singulisphaera acidiphila (strain ATCC BAA-1392 / DSM 18658 / VKM B-2454 / MOB10) TaxID=886293 RepID=L0DI44_SINAD|nr:hypothetical protein Sinac_4328 [Singulisphaera acidiphila DSM 18658]
MVRRFRREMGEFGQNCEFLHESQQSAQISQFPLFGCMATESSLGVPMGPRGAREAAAGAGRGSSRSRRRALGNASGVGTEVGARCGARSVAGARVLHYRSGPAGTSSSRAARRADMIARLNHQSTRRSARGRNNWISRVVPTVAAHRAWLMFPDSELLDGIREAPPQRGSPPGAIRQPSLSLAFFGEVDA